MHFFAIYASRPPYFLNNCNIIASFDVLTTYIFHPILDYAITSTMSHHIWCSCSQFCCLTLNPCDRHATLLVLLSFFSLFFIVFRTVPHCSCVYSRCYCINHLLVAVTCLVVSISFWFLEFYLSLVNVIYFLYVSVSIYIACTCIFMIAISNFSPWHNLLFCVCRISGS